MTVLHLKWWEAPADLILLHHLSLDRSTATLLTRLNHNSLLSETQTSWWERMTWQLWVTCMNLQSCTISKCDLWSPESSIPTVVQLQEALNWQMGDKLKENLSHLTLTMRWSCGSVMHFYCKFIRRCSKWSQTGYWCSWCSHDESLNNMISIQIMTHILWL